MPRPAPHQSFSIADAARRSPVELVETCLARIDLRNRDLHAMIFVDQEGAREAARKAEAELAAGARRGPLHGVPVALKDMIDVAGWPTTAGSKLLGGRIAAEDADCVANLRKAGAILIGKTNMHELTAGGHDNPWFGKVVHPWAPDRGTAGTSSGSAAAVAAGFCAVAVGSDTGGSNRSVAAATGLYGFKPSRGLVPRKGSLPTAPSLDVLGPIATCVGDIRLATEALSGRPMQEHRTRRLDEITIALCPELYGAEVDGVAAAGIAEWLHRCRDGGARIVERRFPLAEELVGAGLTLLMYEFAQAWGARIESQPERAGEAVHDFLRQARRIPNSAYRAALATRDAARAGLSDLLDGCDVLAVPTAPGLAPRLSDETTEVNGQQVGYGAAGGRFRRWANMLDMPALALPVPTGQTFPASLQLAARPGSDADLLSIAATLVDAAAI